MRAERDAASAMYAYERLGGGVEIYGIHGTGLRAFPAANAEVLLHDNAAILALRVSACRAGLSAGGGIAGETGLCLETRR